MAGNLFAGLPVAPAATERLEWTLAGSPTVWLAVH